MSSVIRIDSNRRNGSRSRGPTTPEGKQISAANASHSTGPRTRDGKARASQNSLKHGILAKSAVLPTECPRAYEELHAGLRDVLQPRDFLENELLLVMSHSHWQRKRAWHVESELLTEAIHAQGDQENSENGLTPSAQTANAFKSLSDSGAILKNIRRYEVTHSREFLRHLHEYESRRRAESAEPAPAKRTEPKAG